MDLRQLRYLIALAEELNFPRGGALQRVAAAVQPRHPRSETDIGARLFDRDKHRVALTGRRQHGGGRAAIAGDDRGRPASGAAHRRRL
jgi:DNA-binding transcriptional LysR family regulator